MNLFEFSAQGLQISSMFWVYWCTMIPLTVVTLGSWLGWVYRVKIFSKVYRYKAAKAERSKKIAEATKTHIDDPSSQTHSSRASVHSLHSIRPPSRSSGQLQQTTLRRAPSQYSFHRNSTFASRTTNDIVPRLPNEPLTITRRDTSRSIA